MMEVIMWKRFAAEVIFSNPDDVPKAIDALAAVNCEYEIDHEAVDDYSNAVFGMVTGTTELDETKIGDWLESIVPACFIVRWGYGEPWKIPD